MDEEENVYSLLPIGRWLKETMRVLHLTQELMRRESHIGKEQLGTLLKGGHPLQPLGTSFPHRYGLAQR